MSIKNTIGNGITVQANDSHFDNIKVGWDRSINPSTAPDAGPLSGGYAIYPTECDHTVMDHNEVYGAADAGIYAGQCQHVVAHDNESHNNVLGIEVENTIGAEVYDNNVHDNATGFLLDLLPNLQQKISEDYHYYGNNVHDNNGPNFGQKGTRWRPRRRPGTGMLVLAATKVEITGNTLQNNGGVAVLIVSYDIIDDLAVLNGGQKSTPDPTTPRWPQQIYVHDNTFSNNGGDPQGPYDVLTTATDGRQEDDPLRRAVGRHLRTRTATATRERRTTPRPRFASARPSKRASWISTAIPRSASPRATRPTSRRTSARSIFHPSLRDVSSRLRLHGRTDRDAPCSGGARERRGRVSTTPRPRRPVPWAVTAFPAVAGARRQSDHGRESRARKDAFLRSDLVGRSLDRVRDVSQRGLGHERRIARLDRQRCGSTRRAGSNGAERDAVATRRRSGTSRSGRRSSGTGAPRRSKTRSIFPFDDGPGIRSNARRTSSPTSARFRRTKPCSRRHSPTKPYP